MLRGEVPVLKQQCRERSDRVAQYGGDTVDTRLGYPRNQTAEKTVVAILTDDLTQSKREAINREYEAFQRYIRGDEDADLYSVTKQYADAYVDTDNPRDDHDYLWFIRNDVFDVGVDFGVRWVALPSRNTEFYGREIRCIRHHDLHTRLQEKGAYDTHQLVKAKEYRRVNDRLHEISRAIVEEAKKRNTLIVVGNLESIQNQDLGAEMNRRLHSMPHHTLKNYIKYKPTFAGITVKSVNEYMTSQTCWRCGKQEGTTRKGQGQHLCDECGLDDNADKNSAANIAKKGLGKDIACPRSSLGAVCEPALEPSGADQASATRRLRADLEAPASTKRVVRRAK